IAIPGRLAQKSRVVVEETQGKFILRRARGTSRERRQGANRSLVQSFEGHFGRKAETNDVVRDPLIQRHGSNGACGYGGTAKARPESADALNIVKSRFGRLACDPGEVVVGINDVPLRKCQIAVTFRPPVAGNFYTEPLVRGLRLLRRCALRLHYGYRNAN